MTHILGVDAGNTKTLALIARPDGTVVGAGRSGCGDPYTGAVGTSIPALREAITAALEQAQLQPADIIASGFSMAGADYPEDYAFIAAEVERLGYGRAATIVNDAIGPLWSGSPDGTGVAVTCGTGAATGARSADGRIWHSSFWQQPTGGHELGWQVIRAVCAAELGTGPATALTARVLHFFGERMIEQVLHRVTARGPNEAHVVRHLTPILLDTAHEEDPVASTIVREHGAGLGALALVAARKVGIADTPFPLVLSGGVLRHPSRLLAEALIGRVRAEAPDIHPILSRFEPVVGALLMAMHVAHLAVNEQVRRQLDATLPQAVFFKSDE